MIHRPLLALALAIAVGVAAAGQQPARDRPAIAAGTATLAGTVLENGDPKRPARRVRVTLTNVVGGSPGQTTTTDDAGAFVFRGLPAGRFEVQAFKTAYLRASYGASRPDRAGTPVVVNDGDAVTNLTMSMVRGGVITGVVRDVRGRPVPGVTVRVLRLGYNALTGERTLSAPNGARIGITDDRGEYRAFGLPPGAYVVHVPPPPSFGRSVQPIRQVTADEVRQVLQSARSRTSDVPGSAPAPLVPSASARLDYAPVFHPGTTDIGAATTIALGPSEERAGVDVTIQLVPTATISGTVSASSGDLPAMVSVRLVRTGPQNELLSGAGLGSETAQLQAGGTYAFPRVAPGAYTVKASHGWGRGAAPTGPRQWAAAEVYVSGQDLSVPLTLQPGVPINGRVLFDGATQPTDAELQALSLMLVPPGSAAQPQSSNGGGKVDAEGRFALPSVEPESYRVALTWNAATAREKWAIKSATANGREALEAPLRVNANEPVDLTITLTDRPATLTGLFQDPGGRAATAYYILAFSADRGHWTPGSRRIRMTRPATDGSFTLKGLLPGEYFLAALADLEDGEWNDPLLLEQLVKSAARVTLRDGETTTQNYRIGGG